MTLDERTLELIHGELDGAIDAAGRAELERLAAADPAVRRELDAQRGLAATLAAVEPLEPPPGLATAILANLPQPVAPARGRAFERWFGGLLSSPAARVAAAAAVVAAVGIGVLPRLVDRLPAVDPSAASGTIGMTASGPDSAGLAATAGTVSAGIMFDAAEGAIHVEPAGDGLWTARIAIEALRPMEVEIDAGAAEVRAWTVTDGQGSALVVDGGRLHWTVTGRSGIELTLAVDGTTALELHGARAGAGIGSARVPVGMR